LAPEEIEQEALLAELDRQRLAKSKLHRGDRRMPVNRSDD